MDNAISGYENIRDFLCNIRGNYRNSIYVTCSACRYNKEKECGNFLVSFNKEGVPSCIAVKDADYIFKTITDKSECLSDMNDLIFYELFKNYLKKFETEDECPYRKIIVGNQADLSETEEN